MPGRMSPSQWLPAVLREITTPIAGRIENGAESDLTRRHALRLGVLNETSRR